MKQKSVKYVVSNTGKIVSISYQTTLTKMNFRIKYTFRQDSKKKTGYFIAQKKIYTKGEEK